MPILSRNVLITTVTDYQSVLLTPIMWKARLSGLILLDFWTLLFSVRQPRKGYRCVDINECDNGAHDCSADQVCANVDYGAGFVCIDKKTDPCHKHTCASGSQCRVVNDVAKCVLVNECVELVQPCGWGEICVDQPDGYTCKKDYGHICNDKRRNSCDVNSKCVPLMDHSDTLYECICDAGYDGNKAQGCSDIDECEYQYACGLGEYCVNTPGSFHCFPEK